MTLLLRSWLVLAASCTSLWLEATAQQLHPYCDLCAAAGRSFVITLPEGLPFKGSSGTSCQDLQDLGRAGSIPPNLCKQFQGMVADECGCALQPPSSLQPESTPVESDHSCHVCDGRPDYVISRTAAENSSICGSIRQAATVETVVPPVLCRELTEYTVLLNCPCIPYEEDLEFVADVAVETDMPSQAPTTTPSSSPTINTIHRGPHAVCRICGSDDTILGNPYGNPIPGASGTTCHHFDEMGKRGEIPATLCTGLQALGRVPCACGQEDLILFDADEIPPCRAVGSPCRTAVDCCPGPSASRDCEANVCTIPKKEALQDHASKLYDSNAADEGSFGARTYSVANADRGGVRRRHLVKGE